MRLLVFVLLWLEDIDTVRIERSLLQLCSNEEVLREPIQHHCEVQPQEPLHRVEAEPKCSDRHALDRDLQQYHQGKRETRDGPVCTSRCRLITVSVVVLNPLTCLSSSSPGQ